jgi:hypothetical protein
MEVGNVVPRDRSALVHPTLRNPLHELRSELPIGAVTAAVETLCNDVDAFVEGIRVRVIRVVQDLLFPVFERCCYLLEMRLKGIGGRRGSGEVILLLLEPDSCAAAIETVWLARTALPDPR